MDNEHAHRGGHYHDIKRKYAANPFPGDLVILGAEVFDQATHGCLLME
jgi:hypothetical protein